MPNPSQEPNDAPASSHYFAAKPSSDSKPRTLELSLPDVYLQLTADRGVFASDRIDAGTKYLLLEAPHPPPGNTRVLDLGCGYGAIACTLALRAPDSTVWAIDVNERALELCRRNALKSAIDNLEIRLPGDVPDDIRFDRIYSNPPIRIGKAALHDLLVTWLDRLTSDGLAFLVVQKHLGSDSLIKWLSAQGWPASKLSSRKAYRIIEVGARK